MVKTSVLLLVYILCLYGKVLADVLCFRDLVYHMFMSDKIAISKNVQYSSSGTFMASTRLAEQCHSHCSTMLSLLLFTIDETN